MKPRRILLFLLTMLTACSAITDRIQGTPDDATPKEEAQNRLNEASRVYKALLTAPDSSIPENLIASAECVAVLPTVLKAAFIAGGRYGRGVVSCLQDNAEWSAPAFITLSGGSIGWQIGAESTDLVLFFTGPDARRAVSKSSNITLGADLGVAAGPVGRKAEGKTDFTRTGIYSYAASSGLFAGISLEGAVISADREANEGYYGEPMGSGSIISGKGVPTPPDQVARFLALLPPQ